jgi:hypothetical protein
MEIVKDRQAEHFENVLNWDGITGKDMEENDTLDVNKDIFFEEELVTIQKGFGNNKTSGIDSVVKKFLKYGAMRLKITS